MPTWLNKLFTAYALKRDGQTAPANPVKGKNPSEKKTLRKKAKSISNRSSTRQASPSETKNAARLKIKHKADFEAVSY